MVMVVLYFTAHRLFYALYKSTYEDKCSAWIPPPMLQDRQKESQRNDWLSFIGEVLAMRQLALEVCSRSSLHAVALHYRR